MKYKNKTKMLISICDELIYSILDYCGDPEIINFTSTCKRFYNFRKKLSLNHLVTYDRLYDKNTSFKIKNVHLRNNTTIVEKYIKDTTKLITNYVTTLNGFVNLYHLEAHILTDEIQYPPLLKVIIANNLGVNNSFYNLKLDILRVFSNNNIDIEKLSDTIRELKVYTENITISKIPKNTEILAMYFTPSSPDVIKNVKTLYAKCLTTNLPDNIEVLEIDIEESCVLNSLPRKCRNLQLSKFCELRSLGEACPEIVLCPYPNESFKLFLDNLYEKVEYAWYKVIKKK